MSSLIFGAIAPLNTTGKAKTQNIVRVKRPRTQAETAAELNALPDHEVSAGNLKVDDGLTVRSFLAFRSRSPSVLSFVFEPYAPIIAR